jgi:uncharacterized damage-inducible protein DinB
MLPYGAKDLATAFRTVRKNTIQIAEEIPEDKYDFTAAAGTRPVRQMLAHIAIADSFQTKIHGDRLTTLEGFDFSALVAPLMEEERKPRSKAETIAFLTERGRVFAEWLETLSDSFLSERVGQPAGMGGTSKSRFEMLMSVKEHEMHHRGQLMLIQRMLGLVPHLTRHMQERMAARAARR